jgi:2-polyprenyl-3-methyl-5-hydroxy-6-metoxy-1,4-benzoquinol methylase
LNDSGSKTCPIAYEFGEVNGKKFELEDKPYYYMIQEYLPTSEGYSYTDVLLSLLEQKAFGVYQGDIKHQNIRFDSETGICKFIDYDQAITIDSNLQIQELLKKISELEFEKYNTTKWYRHIENIYDSTSITDGRLNLAKTYSMSNQKTTNTTSGLYHAIQTDDLILEGVRTVDDRSRILDSVTFSQNEKVIDIGCNLGLLAHYLHDRGCNVLGHDNDKHMIASAQLVTNIIGKNIIFDVADLDDAQPPEVDTIMLFSVLHHTKNISANASKIAKSCNRIFLETRLVENGKQFIDNKWQDTSRWSFTSLQQLVKYFELLFSGFKFVQLCGYADKGRMILEFRK